MEDLQSPAVETEPVKIATASSYMATVQTKWFGPGNRRGSRIKATSQHRAGAMWRSCDDSMSIEQNHEEAAKAMLTRNEWEGHWVGGTNQDGTMTWVNTTATNRF
jgi:hypothetical protein